MCKLLQMSHQVARSLLERLQLRTAEPTVLPDKNNDFGQLCSMGALFESRTSVFKTLAFYLGMATMVVIKSEKECGYGKQTMVEVVKVWLGLGN